MLLSLIFAALSNPIFPRRLVVPLLIRVELLKIVLVRCPRLFCIRFSIPANHFLLSKHSTWLNLVQRLCDLLWVITVDSDPFLNSSCSLCNLVKYIAMSSSGFHGKSVSFNCSFFSVFVNASYCFLRWLIIYSSDLCVKLITLYSISLSQDLP